MVICSPNSALGRMVHNYQYEIVRRSVCIQACSVRTSRLEFGSQNAEIRTSEVLPSNTFPNSRLASRDAEVNQRANLPGFARPGTCWKNANIPWTPSNADQLGQGRPECKKFFVFKNNRQTHDMLWTRCISKFRTLYQTRSEKCLIEKSCNTSGLSKKMMPL